MGILCFSKEEPDSGCSDQILKALLDTQTHWLGRRLAPRSRFPLCTLCRYWWLGAKYSSYDGSMTDPGCVLVESTEQGPSQQQQQGQQRQQQPQRDGAPSTAGAPGAAAQGGSAAAAGPVPAPAAAVSAAAAAGPAAGAGSQQAQGSLAAGGAAAGAAATAAAATAAAAGASGGVALSDEAAAALAAGADGNASIGAMRWSVYTTGAASEGCQPFPTLPTSHVCSALCAVICPRLWFVELQPYACAVPLPCLLTWRWPYNSRFLPEPANVMKHGFVGSSLCARVK